MNIKQLQVKIHNRILALRSLKNFLEREDFQAAYEKHGDSKVDEAIESENLVWLRTWLESKTDLTHISVHALRKLACDRGIRGWSQMDRKELLDILTPN